MSAAWRCGLCGSTDVSQSCRDFTWNVASQEWEGGEADTVYIAHCHNCRDTHVPMVHEEARPTGVHADG